MKVVHINTYDQGGGAAIAASRHCEAMIRSGIDAKMITLVKRTYKPYIEKIHLGLRVLFSFVFLLLNGRLLKRIKPKGSFSVMRYGHPFFKDINVKDADIIVIHWVNNNCLTIKGVEQILKLGKPTIWYMHDMFPITGGCHHSLGCEGYSEECRECPLVNSSCKGIAEKQLKAKLKHWKKYSNLTFVTPSTWLADCVRKSALAQGHKVHVMPNVIDTEIFKPLSFSTKEMLGLDPNKKAILFSADLSGSIYKGSQYTIDCLKMLNPDKYEGLVIGNMPKGLQAVVPIKITATGYLMDSLSLVVAYNACDTFIISSIAENYPNVVMEAMACGKPCVGFDTGGIKDFIKHKKNGYLVPDKTSDGLLAGLDYLFGNDELYLELARNARQQILAVNSYNMCNHYLYQLGVLIK
jgi:glycosyltransferase involved in cell wall biosynthesis